MSGGYQNKGASTGDELTAAEELWVQTGNAGVILIAEGTAPGATAGYGKIFVKSSDGLPYFLDDAGNEYAITSGAAAIDRSALIYMGM